MTTRLPTLSQAAEKLNIGPRKFLAELRARKITDAQNFAKREYIQRGFFKIDQRTRVDHHKNREISYYVTTVTDEGLFFLQRIANEIRGTIRIHGSNGAERATAEPEQAHLFGGHRGSTVSGAPQ